MSIDRHGAGNGREPVRRSRLAWQSGRLCRVIAGRVPEVLDTLVGVGRLGPQSAGREYVR